MELSGRAAGVRKPRRLDSLGARPLSNQLDTRNRIDRHSAAIAVSRPLHVRAHAAAAAICRGGGADARRPSCTGCRTRAARPVRAAAGIYLVLDRASAGSGRFGSRNIATCSISGRSCRQSAALAIPRDRPDFRHCLPDDRLVGRQLTGLIVVASCSLMEGRPEATIPAILLALAIGLTVGAINGFSTIVCASTASS